MGKQHHENGSVSALCSWMRLARVMVILN